MTNDWLDGDADAALAASEEAMDAMANSETWDPKEGDELRGVLLAAKLVATKYGPSYLITVKTTDGTYDVWVKAVLRRALLEQRPGFNRGILIKYAGKKQGDTYEYHQYSMASEPFRNEDEQLAATKVWAELVLEEADMAERAKERKEAKAAGKDDPLEAPF